VCSSDLPHLEFLESALRSARRSPYRYPDRVFTAFEVMEALAYQRMEGPFGQSLKDVFATHGLDYVPHLSDTSSGGRIGKEHRFRSEGEDVLMEPHLRFGRDFDPQNSLRVHFEWVEESKRWTIAYVGRHLPNTKS
jgi:hypothetical protein